MMSILDSLFTDKYDHKKTVYQTTSGKKTKILSTVESDLCGRFEPLRGDIPVTFAGRSKNATHRLFTKINSNLEPGHILVDANSIQYGIVSIEKRNYFGMGNHLEILLEERNSDIS